MEGSRAPWKNSLTSLILPSGSSWRSTDAVAFRGEGPDFSWLTSSTPTPNTECLDLWVTGTTSNMRTASQGMSRMDGMETGSPNPALRSLQKKSGLFDNEHTDDLLDELPSVTDALYSLSDEQPTTLAGDSIDLLSSTQSDLNNLFGDLGATTDDLLTSLGGDKFDPEAVDLPSLPDSPFDLEGGMDFGEQFTDLTQLTNAILGEDAINLFKEEASQDQSFIAVPVISSSSSVSVTISRPSTSTSQSATVTRNKKRKIKETVTSSKPCEITSISSCTVAVAPNHDHDDYTAKRPKLSASSLDESESFSDCESISSSMSSSTMGALSSDKYKTRRMKNNVASRRSRATRKQKFQDMEDRVGYLENQNEVLKEKIEIMEGLAKSLKQHLVARMAAK